jgi:hypothetical protein
MNGTLKILSHPAWTGVCAIATILCLIVTIYSRNPSPKNEQKSPERPKIDFGQNVKESNPKPTPAQKADPKPTLAKEAPLDTRPLIPRLVDQLFSTVLPADFERPAWLLPIASSLTTLGILGLIAGLMAKAEKKREKPG